MSVSSFLSRREFLAAAAVAPAGAKAYLDRAMGCWLGAAIGDAMGGPVEIQHYKRIEKHYGDFKDLLPYRKPPGLIDLKPGYAKHSEAGSITDDTYIRMDLARYLLAEKPPYSPKSFAEFLLKHADFENWWGQAVKILKRVESGELKPEEAGLQHIPGGGGGWWQPVAILNAGNPKAAYELSASLCRIWKAPFEQNVLGAVVAGQAAAFHAKATIDSVAEIVLKSCAPLARKLFARALDVARAARDPKDLYQRLHDCCLVDMGIKELDAPMPPAVKPLDYSDKGYTSASFAEQQPWALAYLVFGKGDPEYTVLTAAKGGRDADSIATNTASWLGALGDESIWPKKWRDAVEQANQVDFDLKKTCEELVAAGRKYGNVTL